MTLPRQVLPGQTYLLTRRCLERRFLLRPDPEVTQTFLYCLGLAAERHGVEVSSVTALANHHHTTAFDPRGELPAFGRDLHGSVARALNVFRRRGESFWAPGSYSAVRLEDKEAVLARMVYTITNVVEAGLVERPEDWPGYVQRGVMWSSRLRRLPGAFWAEASLHNAVVARGARAS